jgi:hypothetical protein
LRRRRRRQRVGKLHLLLSSAKWEFFPLLEGGKKLCLSAKDYPGKKRFSLEKQGAVLDLVSAKGKI